MRLTRFRAGKQVTEVEEDASVSSDVSHAALKEDTELAAMEICQSRDVNDASQGPWQSRTAYSMVEVHSSVAVPHNGKWWAKIWSFTGMGFIVSVGYMDPGNWATDISSGSLFGYRLLSCVLLSSVTAMFLQHLSLKLGAATERDLAQCCRDAFPFWRNIVLYVACEIAIAATDLAEVIGAGIAMNLLFGIPIWLGVLITGLDVLILLAFGTKNFRLLELLVFGLVATVMACFVVELSIAKPDWLLVAEGLIPRPSLITDGKKLYNGIGILGATVMPHNLFIHSSIIMTRAYNRTDEGKQMAVRYGTWDSNICLSAAFFVNAAILILAGSAFYYGDHPNNEVSDIITAYELLSPALGAKAARILFAVGLLAAGQSATITGTLAGQVVMEGFLDFKMKPWMRRMITRMVAIIPASIVAGVGGARLTGKLLVLSQVVLSLMLPFAVIPLVFFTCSPKYMGDFVNGMIAKCVGVFVAVVICGLNVYLVYTSIADNSFEF